MSFLIISILANMQPARNHSTVHGLMALKTKGMPISNTVPDFLRVSLCDGNGPFREKEKGVTFALHPISAVAVNSICEWCWERPKGKGSSVHCSFSQSEEILILVSALMHF